MTVFIVIRIIKKSKVTKYSNPDIRYKVIERIEFRINDHGHNV